MDTIYNTESNFFCSKLDNVFSDKPSTIDFTQFLYFVKIGIFKERIELIRSKQSKEERNLLKSTLPCISTSCIFEGRRLFSNVKRTSNLICIDIDNISDLETLRLKLLKDEFIYSFFVSPSGNGFKVFFVIHSTISTFIHYFNAIERYFLLNYNIQIDKVCKDIVRLCYISFDPNLYLNKHCKIFTDTLIIKKSPTPYISSYKPESNKNLTEIIIQQIKINKIDITSSYFDWIRICYSLINEFGVNAISYFLEISQFYPGFDPEKAIKQFNNCLRTTNNCISIKTLYKIAAWHGIFYNQSKSY